ncbi:hypothetical protein U9M48_001965 [Paspalum notatum var. saurae]|uniref:Uncharacterized protein n=1 Tax=Paspalum notatum var. saurae TaxID=547442 RepID=A0AAQ3SD77_PASNO
MAGRPGPSPNACRHPPVTSPQLTLQLPLLLLLLATHPRPDDLGERGGGVATLFEPVGGGLLELGHLLPDLGAPPSAHHHLPHRRGDLDPAFRLGHPHGGADAVREHHRVLPLLGVERPGHHGHAVRQALEHRVPAAVREEPARGGVRQHPGLRRPRRHQEARALGPVHEALGQVRERVPLALRVVASDLSWSGMRMSGPGTGTHPGSRSGSGRSRNSPGILASRSGRWRMSVSAWRLVGKKRQRRRTPAARAASNASAPNRSATNATRRVVRRRSARTAVRAGTERAHSSDMRVSMAEPAGRSERSTGGSAREETAGGREARNARCVAEAVDAKVSSVEVSPWREDRRFASSASGIRCPMPGVASIATCGGRSSSPLA